MSAKDQILLVWYNDSKNLHMGAVDEISTRETVDQDQLVSQGGSTNCDHYLWVVGLGGSGVQGDA